MLRRVKLSLNKLALVKLAAGHDMTFLRFTDVNLSRLISRRYSDCDYGEAEQLGKAFVKHHLIFHSKEYFRALNSVKICTDATCLCP